MIKIEIELQEPMFEMLTLLARLQMDYTTDEAGVKDVIDGLIEDGVGERIKQFPAIVKVAEEYYGKEYLRGESKD